jgi:glycerophosphoryl diester phosphodiesterase
MNQEATDKMENIKMHKRMLEIGAGAGRALVLAWRELAITDLAYKAVAFAILTPGTALFLRWMISRTGVGVVADADIAAFFFTTRQGIIALLLGCAILLAISILEPACVMVIGLAAKRGIRLVPRGALMFGAAHALAILRLAGLMVLRVVIALVPFILAGAAVYFGLLHGHDINYYLARKPTEFWVAVALFVPILAVLAWLVLRTVARWALTLPLLLFEGVTPRGALRESAARARGNYRLILLVLGVWFVLAMALNAALTTLMDAVGSSMGPHLAGSVAMILLFVASLAFLWIVLGISIAIFNAVLFSLIIVQLYLIVGKPAGSIEAAAVDEAGKASRLRVSPVMAGTIAAVAALIVIGIGLLAFLGSKGNQPVLVIAHRGASVDAPENTLAAFRLAAAERADFVELDVQESLDGSVVVTHDSDLMKVAGSPMKIWEHALDELRAIGIGSYSGPQFKDEHMATLAEALAVCKGSARVLIELKSYGHNQSLEEKVVSIVEAAGMAGDCMYMSLDHSMTAKMKQLRPSWRVGVLAAKARGDLTTLHADFLAVEARMATRRFVRRAHRAHQDVYVWTVDDPAWMLSAMSNGADGLITNMPARAREVVEWRARMSDAQRVLVALLVRLGASTDALEAENALRP